MIRCLSTGTAVARTSSTVGTVRPSKQGPRLGREHQELRAAGACSPGHVFLDERAGPLVGRAARAAELDGVGGDGPGHRNRPDQVAQLQQRLALEGRLGESRRAGGRLEDDLLLLGRRG